MENENENIHNLAKNMVDNVISKSLKKIELIDKMNRIKEPLSPISEESEMDSDSANEQNVMVDVSLDNEIDLESIIESIKKEKSKREQKKNYIYKIKKYCCWY